MKRVTVGSATLIQSDAMDVLPRLAANSIDFVFTDPPYGHNNNNGDLIHKWEKALGRPSKKTASARPILNDGPEANDLVRRFFGEAARLLPPGACCCCCCCGGGGPDPQFARWSLWLDESVGFKQMVIWDKGPMGMGWHYRRSYETVLVGQRPGGKARWHDSSRRVENVIRPGDYGIRKIIPRETDHPTPKPVELARHFIRLHTQPGDLILDPFMGGGSTAEAAILEGRRFIGVELDPAFFEMSRRRAERALKSVDRVAAGHGCDDGKMAA